MGGISLVSLISSGFNIGWVEPLRKIVEQYLIITNTVRYAVEPFIVPAFNAFAEFFFLKITIGPRWPDVFLLMLIYLGSRVKSYFAGGRYVRALAMLMLSIGICIVSSCFSSSVNLSNLQGVLVATSIPLLGFLVYDLVYGCIGATMDRRNQATWFHEFKRHLAFSVPLVIVALLLNLVLAMLFVKVFRNSYQAFVMLFAIDYVVISGYWAIMSLHHARQRKNRNLGESTSERFWRSSATNVSLNVALVLFSAIAFMLFNAGLQQAGPELPQLSP